MPLWVQVRLHKVRSLKTLCVMSACLSLGLVASIVGPTLLDLRQQVQTTITTIAYVLTCRAGGHAIGSVVSE